MTGILDGFPLSAGFLESYRLELRKRARAGQVGEHLLRRKGLSLEFEDFAPYTPGADFRHIDWRASVRYGEAQDLLIRRFRAEERLTILVSVDNRATMTLLPSAPKLRVACWLAYSVAAIAAGSGDRVFLHRLFGPPGSRIEEIRRHGLGRAGRFLRDLEAPPREQGAEPDLGPVSRLLSPASVWLVVTDLYFAPEAEALARALTRAQQGLRWVILVDLDNWPQERRVLGHGGRHIAGPGLGETVLEVEIGQPAVRAVETAIEAAKRSFLAATRHAGLSFVRWRWPASTEVDLGAFFRRHFENEPVLKRLFRRER